ncbi:MAG TPA: transposase, partial [Methylocella sp.]|nr:transposase [Methylocella sp.]
GSRGNITDSWANRTIGRRRFSCRSPIAMRACQFAINSISRKGWADDAARREKAGVPEDIILRTKPKIALGQLRWACQTGRLRVVLFDAGYGKHSSLHEDITSRGLSYVVGILVQSRFHAACWAQFTSANRGVLEAFERAPADRTWRERSSQRSPCARLFLKSCPHSR